MMCGFNVFSRVFILVVVILLVVWLALDTSKRPTQLISFGGVCVFIVLIFLFSAHRTMVSFPLSHSLYCDDISFETFLAIVSQIISVLVPLSSYNLVELLAWNNSDFYGDCFMYLMAKAFLFFTFCFRYHGGLCFGVSGYSSALAFLLYERSLDL